jgi:Uma2 family endonuclease
MEKPVSPTTGIRYTAQEYLRLEKLAETKSEYFDGEILPMPGVTREHNLINGNLVFELKNQLAGRPCEVYFCDMKVKTPATGSYAYPDIAALCGEPQFDKGDTGVLLNPQLLVEVLSESTERHDRGLKLQHYRSIDNLLEYVLVSQSECRVERYARNIAGEWVYGDATNPEGTVELTSIACRIPLSRIYDRVLFNT